MESSRANAIASGQTRSRSRSRSRNRSRSTSRRPSLNKRSLSSSSSIGKLDITPIEIQDRPIPRVGITLDNTLPLDFFKQDILALTKTLRISKWHKKTLNVKYLKVNRISGALTNSIYKIEYNDGNIELPSLLLRVYGKNLDSIIDRDLELDILIKLSSKKIGPKLLGIFSNGRFEQFLEGFITLDKDQVKHEVISQMIGRRMKDLHYKIELDSHDYESKLPMCWRLIYKWLSIIEKDIVPSYIENKVDIDSVFLTSFENFKKLIELYRNYLFNLYDVDKFTENYKFCHNDTQYGNLLLDQTFNPKDIILQKELPSSATSYSAIIDDDEEDDDYETDDAVVISTSNKKDTSLVVIDFEYSGPNFPAFDLEDHFSEWMSDYHNPEKSYFIHGEFYPNQLQKLNLIKSYIEYDFQYPSSNLNTKIKFNDFSKTNATDLIQFEIKKLYNETIYWRSTVQIYWCLWGILQNGPFKPNDDINTISQKSEEQGVNSIYNISTGVDSMSIDDHENLIIEDAITSSDDDFDYFKYSQQKAAIVIGDLIGLGLISKSDIDVPYHNIIKYLDCNLFDI